MAQSKGHKQFPFNWRAAWLALGRVNPTAAYVWNYMFWRSDKDNIFDLEESLVCKDTGLERKTLCKARSLIAKHGGFNRLYSRNAQGQLIVKYQMLGFEDGEQVPENGTSSKSQTAGLEPSTVLRNPAKRDHTVNTPSVDTSSEGKASVDTSIQVSEKVRAADAASMLAVGEDSADPEPTPREQMLLKALGVDLWRKGEVSSLRSILKFMSVSDFWNFWHWNQQHKSGKLQFFTVSQALSAIDSDSPRSAVRQWNKHEKDSSSCPKRCSRVPLTIEIVDQEFWDNLVKYNLVGNVGVKWYTGKSPEEAISGYPDKDSLLKDLFEDRNYELRAKLQNMICQASGGYFAQAFERECICEPPKEACSICGVPERGIL